MARLGDKSFLPPSGTLDRPTVQAWLERFERCIVEECRKLFGPEWEVVIDLGALTVAVQRMSDGATCSTRLHAGMYVVTPRWAAQRISDQLHFQSVALGHVPPPPGAALATSENMGIVASLARRSGEHRPEAPL